MRKNPASRLQLQFLPVSSCWPTLHLLQLSASYHSNSLKQTSFIDMTSTSSVSLKNPDCYRGLETQQQGKEQVARSRVMLGG